LSLEKALALAKRNNPQLLAARQSREIARARLQKARYWNPFNPEIEAGAARRWFDEGGADTQRSAGVSLEVEVARQRGKRIAEAEWNLARIDAEIADVERLLSAQVKETFYRALYLRQRLRLLEEVEKLNLRLRDAAAERFKSGQVSRLEANLAAIRYGQSRTQTLAAGRDYDNALRDLEKLTGRKAAAVRDLAGDLRVQPLDAPLDAPVEALVEKALGARPDLLARAAEIERVEAERALTRRLALPNPTLRAGYDEEAESRGSRDRLAGASVSIPLPIFDRRQAELSALGSLRRQATYEREATAASVATEVQRAYTSVQAALQAVRVLEADAVERIEETLPLVETAYGEGKLDLVQVVVLQKELVRAKLRYLDAIWGYWRARVDLERAVGTGLARGEQAS